MQCRRPRGKEDSVLWHWSGNSESGSVLDVTHLYDYIFLQDDPLKSSMHSFLMSSTHQQEIANLDAKASCQLWRDCVSSGRLSVFRFMKLWSRLTISSCIVNSIWDFLTTPKSLSMNGLPLRAETSRLLFQWIMHITGMVLFWAGDEGFHGQPRISEEGILLWPAVVQWCSP